MDQITDPCKMYINNYLKASSHIPRWAKESHKTTSQYQIYQAKYMTKALNKKKSAKIELLLNQGRRSCSLGDFRGAEDACKKILAINTDNKEAFILLSEIAARCNRPTDSAALIQSAIQKHPSDPALYLHLGQLLSRFGDIDNALQAYNHATKLNPRYLNAYLSCGYLLFMVGRYADSVQQYLHAIEIDPKHAPTYYNLALSQATLGDIEGAVKSYETAITINPKYDAAHFNLANLYRSIGNMPKAIMCYANAARIAGDQKLYWQQLADAMWSIDTPADKDKYLDIIIDCLKINGIDSQGLTKPVVAHLYKHYLPHDIHNIDDANQKQKILMDAVTHDKFNSFYAYTPLNQILERTIINDPLVEQLLVIVRRRLLTRYMESQRNAENYDFVVSLSHQCHLNEYVYSENNFEANLCQALLNEIRDSEPGEIDVYAVALLGCYIPLNTVFSPDKWTELSTIKKDNRLSGLLKQQVFDPAIESGISAEVSNTQDHSHQINDIVRDQYEENPYPRWVELPYTPPRPASDVIGQLFPGAIKQRATIASAPNILVAGCGTGRHALLVAKRFLHSKVMAIDISGASLAYATRKSRELGIKNVEFRQLDLLQIDGILNQYDIIESVGVLHHLADPFAGWKKLRDHMKVGGFMKIGLYSEYGRKSIKAAQKLIASENIESSATNIRAFRKRMMDLPKTTTEADVTRFRDFYSLSGCRDLIFHEREKWFTLPEIEKMISDLGLEFIGFELEEQILNNEYRIRYPDDPFAISLKNWHNFEQEHTSLFASMYQFWVYRPH